MAIVRKHKRKTKKGRINVKKHSRKVKKHSINQKKVQDIYRKMVQKGYITLEDANRTLIASNREPLGYTPESYYQGEKELMS